jgi:hypothetical protein
MDEDKDNIDGDDKLVGFDIEEDDADEEENHEEMSTTRTGHTAGAAVRPANRNVGVVESSLSNQERREGASIMLDLDRVIPIRGMSKSESLRIQQKHVANRIRVFVKTDIFRQIKFIKSNAMFQKAITLVMDHENVPHNRRRQYQSI